MRLVKNRSTVGPRFSDKVFDPATNFFTSGYPIDPMHKPNAEVKFSSKGIQTSNEHKVKSKQSTEKYASKNFEILFGNKIGSNERLIADFSGALIRDMIISGRLYIFPNHLCFYGSLLKWETKIVIALSEISSIVKAKTIKVIPNAIQITTRKGDKYVFTSLISRHKVYLSLVSAWTANLSRSLLNHDTNKEKPSVDPTIRKCYSNLESGSRRFNENSKKMKCDAKSNRKYFSTGDLADINDSRESCLKVERVDADKSVKISKALRDPSKCPYSSSEFLADLTIPINLDRLFEMLFTESTFANTFAESLKHSITIIKDWSIPDENDLQESGKSIIGIRRFNRQMVLDYPFAKNMSSEEVLFLEHLDASNYYGIRLISESAGIPLCSLFYVVNYFCLHRTANSSETRFHFHYKIVFKSKAWGFKSLIEEGTKKACQEYCDSLIQMMQKWSIDHPDFVAKIGFPSQLKAFSNDETFTDSNHSSDNQLPSIVIEPNAQSNSAQKKNMDQTNQKDSNCLSPLSTIMPNQTTHKMSNSNSCSNCKSCDDSHVHNIVKNLKPFIVFILLITIVNLFLMLRLINNLSLSSCPSNQVSSSSSLIGLSTADETFESLSNYAYPSLGCRV